MAEQNIKSMKLYSHMERVHRELEEMGIDRESPLGVEDLAAIDQLHYHGHDAVALSASRLGLTADSRVAEVGSGMGGPARYLAASVGCHVTALELQPDLNELAISLTDRCSLSERVTHLCGDVLDDHLSAGAFDAVVSWLALYHIGDHDALFAQIGGALRPGGGLYVEDLGRRGDFTPEEQDLMRGKLFGNCTPSAAEYEADLGRAGFTDIKLEDVSDDWTEFTTARLAAYRNQRSRHVRVHDEETVDDMDEFYGTVVRLFQGGNMAGFRITARKA
ncbi:MAG: methyltransferase domain-containing protein [Pseudomonadota bacterium]